MNRRNSNIELLRIIAICMIIGYHYVVHGYFAEGGVLYNIILDIISMGGKIGVNIFCIIMGYFGVKSINVDLEKIIKTEFQVFFYSYLGLAIICIVSPNLISFENIVQTIFPVITGHYWFFTSYIIVFCFSVLFNQFLLHLSRENYIKLLVLCYVIWGLIPFFTAQESSGMFWNQLIWFFVMYFTGAFIYLHPVRISCKMYYIGILVSATGMILSFVVLELMSQRIDFFKGHTTYFRWSNSPFSIISSISLFEIANVSKKKVNATINTIAGCTLGIYLLHENIFIQKILWGKIFNPSKIFTLHELICHAVGAILFVFVSGVIVELIRKQIEKLFGSPINFIANKVYFGYSSICRIFEHIL